jgi:hypothetical protein
MRQVHVVGAIVLSGAALLAASAPSLRAQVQAGGKVLTAPGGVSVVVARSIGPVRSNALVKAAPGPRFRALSAQARAAVAQTAGVPAPPASGAFLLTPHQLIIDGRGWIYLNPAFLGGQNPEAILGTDAIGGGVDVYSAGSPTTKQFMVHFQVSNWLSRTYNYQVTNMLDGSKYIVAATPDNKPQDIVIFVLLPNDTPISSPFFMLRLEADRPAAPFFFTGVEITPM